MTDEDVLRRRMHGLYVSRPCEDLLTLAREMMGLHCWFARNVVFSALIRGADISGWKHALTKTWVHHALHGVAYDDLPALLSLHAPSEPITEFEREVLRCMEDGVFARTQFRKLFADRYDEQFIARAFSPWGGVFVTLARRGFVAFRDMTSRDFDLIDAPPTQTALEVLPALLRRYFTAYGPATIADAAWFFGLGKDEVRAARDLPLDEFERFEAGKQTYFYIDRGDTRDIPEVTLLSGFDPLIVSYADRRAALPAEYKKRVILSSGICLPTVAVNGRVAGVWNIQKGQPVVELFEPQPKRVENAARDRAETMCWRSKPYL